MPSDIWRASAARRRSASCDARRAAPGRQRIGSTISASARSSSCGPWSVPQRAGLAAAILLGAREGLPYEETEPYLQTGTIHVLVVSGMNVAILAYGLVVLMRMGWLPRRIGLSVIVAVVVIYTLLAEAQPPVVRAAVLGVLGCMAIWIGRRGVAFNSLVRGGAGRAGDQSERSVPRRDRSSAFSPWPF